MMIRREKTKFADGLQREIRAVKPGLKHRFLALSTDIRKGHTFLGRTLKHRCLAQMSVSSRVQRSIPTCALTHLTYKHTVVW